MSLTVIEERLTQRRRILNTQNRLFILCIKMRPFKARAEIASGGNATFCVLTRMHERAITNNKKHIVAVYRSEKKKNHSLIVTHLLRRQKHFLVDRNNHEEFSRSFRFYRGAITPRRGRLNIQSAKGCVVVHGSLWPISCGTNTDLSFVDRFIVALLMGLPVCKQQLFFFLFRLNSTQE